MATTVKKPTVADHGKMPADGFRHEIIGDIFSAE
jgi:hypothetical protein